MTLGFQGYLAVPGYPSSQQVLGNLGHLYLPCGQGNLVIHLVLSVQEFQLGLGYHQLAHLGVLGDLEYLGNHQHHALPSVQEYQNGRHHQEIQVLQVCQAGPCLLVIREDHLALELRVLLLTPLQADPYLLESLELHPFPDRRQKTVPENQEFRSHL